MEDIATEEAAPARELAAPPRRRSARAVLFAALLAFVAGILLTGWLVAQGNFDRAMKYFGRETPAPARVVSAPPLDTPPPVPQAVTADEAIGSVEARLAFLEDRMSRIDIRAEAASGNAARAEALLIAFAARRLIERGDELGFLEDQLRLRFSNAQPKAVDTIVAFSKDPVTRDELLGQLEALSPRLGSAPSDQSPWSRLQAELSSLFVVRRDTLRPNAPEDRLARARLLLTAGKIDEATELVSHMPGALVAEGWIASARRYGEVERALDLIETSALLESQRLNDATGAAVTQPGPGALPAPQPQPTPEQIRP